MSKYRIIILFSYFISKCWGVSRILEMNFISTKTFMYWENATIPFYINPDHFDTEQALAIMTTLSMFAFKTCLKFAPVLAAPDENQHVLTFINPDGVRRCKVHAQGHSNFHPHLVHLGYECLVSPHLDMVVMRALGFPFEHNRMSRDVFIDVMIENIEPSAVELFTKDSSLPPALRALPYDINSVMHFDERQYSKNGHRTIIFKNPNTRQNRISLSETDLKKIEVVYGSECRKRDRQEKIELCQSYPGVARRKRSVDIEPPANKSLRVNPDITPPASIIETPEPTPLQEEIGNQESEYLTASLKALGIANETEAIIENVYKVSALALRNARAKYCNISSNISTASDFNFENTDKMRRSNSSDILGILEVIADYARSMVDNAVSNLTVFCENSETIETYERQCKWSFGNARCPKTYRSTKSGPVKASTQHRPVYKQQTRHVGGLNKYSYDRARRSADTTPAIAPVRRKREVTDAVATPKPAEEDKEKKKEKKILKEKVKIVEKEKIEIVKDNSTTKATVATDTNTTKSNEDKKSKVRRFFQEKRYKVKHPHNGSDMDFEESNVSMEKEKKEDTEDTEDKTNQKKDEKDDSEDEDDEEEDKEIEIAAEKVINKEELVKEVLNEGLEKLIGGEKEAIEKSFEETKEDAEEKVAEEHKNIEPIIEKEKDVESEKESSSETDKVAEVQKMTAEDIDVETTTQKKKRRKVKTEKEVSEKEVENTTKKEGRLKKKSKGLKQKNRSENTPITVKLNKLNEEFYNERKWPDGKVRYVIKRIPEYDLEDLRNRLAEVNSILTEKTCVRLYEVDAQEAHGYEDYLVLDTSPDYVTGRVGGKQIFGSVELFRGGQHKQHTAMMVMAMLGFYFEVSRHDRDRHIRVHMRHVRPDKLHHFEKIRNEATLDIPYDYQSATHPAWQFWRKIGKTGISTVATFKEQDPDGSVMRALGQNPQLLSDYDIVKINSVYGVDCFQNKRAENETTPKARRHRSPRQKN